MRRFRGSGVLRFFVFILFMTSALPACAVEGQPAEDDHRIPDPGNGGAHFQVLGSSGGGRVYNAGFWGWGHGGIANLDLTAIRGADMGDVYGVDAMTGIMLPHYVMPVPALGVVAGYNVDRQRLFFAVYPEVSIRVMLWRGADLDLVGRYYISSEGTDENLLFIGLGFNWAFSSW